MTVREIRDNELRLYVNSWGKTVKRKLIKTSGDNQVAACFFIRLCDVVQTNSTIEIIRRILCVNNSRKT